MARDTTLTELLTKALNAAESLTQIAKATGVPKATLIRFRRGEQTMTLASADRLAAHFGIRHTQPQRPAKARRG
ncbi:MAG: helix-turn-helix transcriptional regulator [Phycisphaerales bacterium]|nr:helix-turn-helix transcriptional regulator [Phycisphaerales bacterium]